MSDRHDSLPDEYRLPVVGGQAVADVLRSIKVGPEDDPSSIVEFNLQPAFELLRSRNLLISRAVAMLLGNAGYTAPELKQSSLVGMSATHLLLLAQARIDRGLPGVDLSSNEYPLPIVTVDALNTYFAGAGERARATGMTPEEELAERNGWIPQVLEVLDIRISPVGFGELSSQVGAIAAVVTHGLLHEQADIDALGAQWGNSPLG